MAGPLSASAPVSLTANIPAIVAAAGGDPARARLDGEVLTVPGVTQAALEAAIAEGSDSSFALRSIKVQQAGGILAAKIAAGMPWMGKVLQIDEASQNRLNSMSIAASIGSLPEGAFWVMADNTTLDVDAAGMLAMSTAALSYVFALRAHFWGLRSALLAAPDAAAVQAIDVLAGWPVPPASPEP